MATQDASDQTRRLYRDLGPAFVAVADALVYGNLSGVDTLEERQMFLMMMEKVLLVGNETNVAVVLQITLVSISHSRRTYRRFLYVMLT